MEFKPEEENINQEEMGNEKLTSSTGPNKTKTFLEAVFEECTENIGGNGQGVGCLLLQRQNSCYY